MNDFLGNSENYNATHFFPPSFKHLFYKEWMMLNQFVAGGFTDAP